MRDRASMGNARFGLYIRVHTRNLSYSSIMSKLTDYARQRVVNLHGEGKKVATIVRLLAQENITAKRQTVSLLIQVLLVVQYNCCPH